MTKQMGLDFVIYNLLYNPKQFNFYNVDYETHVDHICQPVVDDIRTFC